MIPSCFPVFSEHFFIPLSFLQFLVLNSFVETCYSFCFHLLFLFSVFLFFCLFLSFVLFFWRCLHTFCEHRLVRIVLLSSVCLFLVFSTPCSDPFVLIPLFFFLRNNYRSLSSVISSFLVLFLVHHLSFSSYHKTFLSFSFRSFVCFSF